MRRMDSVIYLVDENLERDVTGVMKKKATTKRRVFCDVRSVGANEFFEGGRNGLNPEYKVVMFAGDYNGERTVEYDGQQYGVYRTYKGEQATRYRTLGVDYMELYLERKGGTNGKRESDPG